MYLRKCNINYLEYVKNRFNFIQCDCYVINVFEYPFVVREITTKQFIKLRYNANILRLSTVQLESK